MPVLTAGDGGPKLPSPQPMRQRVLLIAPPAAHRRRRAAAEETRSATRRVHVTPGLPDNRPAGSSAAPSPHGSAPR
eukprot:366431-Chlamydomonas_euryale.AAC.16